MEQQSYNLNSAKAMLQDFFCYEWQDRQAIAALCKKLVDEASLEKHWVLIRELFRWCAPQTYRHFAHQIALDWCGRGRIVHPWQQFPDLPRESRYSIATRREALIEVSKAARNLEKALRSGAVDPNLNQHSLGFVNRKVADILSASRSEKLIPVPVVELPLASTVGKDSVLSRLSKAIGAQTFTRLPTMVRRSGEHAREAYFAQCTARSLFYFSPNRRRYRRKIEQFIADLIIVLSFWENEVVDYDGERVRQSLRRALNEVVQPR